MTDARRTETENTPRAFIDYIRRTAFDRSGLRPWERETLSSLLGLPKISTCPECGAPHTQKGAATWTR